MPLKLAGSVLTLAIIAAVAVTITLTAEPTQAQTPDNTYTNPQPCGPGAGTAFQPEPHEITEGHYALFDAYWEWRRQHTEENPGNEGVLHTNTCPPKLVKTTETDDFGQSTTVTELEDSNIDIDEAIFHVLDDHKATVVASASQNPSGVEIAMDDYPILDSYADAGDQVWWLRLDDPATTTVDETSDLALGFSTKRFDDRYWAGAPDGGPPLRYKFELYRNPGIDPAKHPHFLAYRAPGVWEGGQEANGVELVWDSADPDDDEHDVFMSPGQLEDLQWVFTKPGTYVLSVHLLGYVRQEENPPPNAEQDWKPINGDGVVAETSEVKQYVIQVGTKFIEVEPPKFGVSRSVPENSPAGTNVGEPIQVFGAEVDDLSYSLSGKRAEDFALDSTSDPDTVQIKVADGAHLDYETHSTYDLILGVSDNVDHENNPDPTIDHTLAVQIALDDVPSVVLHLDNPNPTVGDTVTFTGHLLDVGEVGSAIYTFTASDGIHVSHQAAHQIRHTGPATETVHLDVAYVRPGVTDFHNSATVSAEPVTVTWRSP